VKLVPSLDVGLGLGEGAPFLVSFCVDVVEWLPRPFPPRVVPRPAGPSEPWIRAFQCLFRNGFILTKNLLDF